MNVQLLIVYCITIFIASIIPGPSMLLAFIQGNRFGIVAGCIAALGNVIASVIQGAIALLVIVETGSISSKLLLIIKFIGSAYIIYLGLTLFKVNEFSKPTETNINHQNVSALKHCWYGFTFAIFNPKALTFFAALFPQFVTNQSITLQTLMNIFVPIILIAFICFMLYVIGGNTLFRLLGDTKHIGKILGSIIILAGAALAFS